jgi:biotin carboxylase
MSLFREATHRDLVLFVNGIRPATIEAIETYRDRYDKSVSLLILVDQKKKGLLKEAQIYAKHKKVQIITCDTDSVIQIKKCLEPYVGRLLAVTSQFENSIPTLQKVLPHVPYLNGPTEESLDWSTDKVKMRRLLKSHDNKITPRFTVIKDYSEKSMALVEKNVGFPVVVKPSGLAASLLVSICYHREELEETLKATFKKIDKVHKEQLGRGRPQILVEQFMEGLMYSIDAYVNDRGNIYYTPPVHIKTGREVGFDDFFGYQQMTPTRLTKNKINNANHVCTEAIRALGIRSSTCHIELIKTISGWKIIELAPRMGGYRHTMYSWSFGINHILNDILIRIPQKPVIPKKRKGFTAAFKIFAKTEGKLETIKGIKKTRMLKSFVHLTVNKRKGDPLAYAKNGGKAVIELTLFNNVRSDLLADIRRMEKSLEVVVELKRRKA